MNNVLPSVSAIRALALAVVVTFTPILTTTAQELRAVWVDAWGAGFLTSAEVTKLVSDCQTYNFNAVFVQMRRRGDAFYMPQAPNGDPRTTAIASNYDALQEIINQCHNASPRIEVHAWVVTHLIWSSTSAPSQPGHVYNLHPEYLMKNSAGATYMAEGYYLDPGHPEAALWNYNMAMDIVTRYDIDGLQWDYIRYPQQDSGYNDTAIARYNAEFGLTGLPPVSSTQFSTWRRRQVTDFLRWTSADLLAVKPNLQISCAVFSSRSDAYTARFQDWAAWNNEGILDLCIPMTYSADNAGVYNPRVDDAFNNQGVRRVYIGPGAYLNTKENTVTQLLYARSKPLLGTVLYSYRTPNSGTVNQAATFAYIRDNYQPAYQAPPTLPWKAAPTKGIVKGTIIRPDTGEPVYNATVVLQSSPARTQLSDAHGKFAFFESAPGNFIIGASAAGLGTATANVIVAAGQVVTVDLVLSTADTTPPAIGNVAVESLADTSATITWTTDENADSIVEYGLTTAYGGASGDPTLVLNHAIALTGLIPNTTYHYRVHSTDAADNSAVSGDYTFTTYPSGSAPEIIVDNTAAVVAGSWSAGTSSTDKYGADYRYKSQGTGAAYLAYTPNIQTAGFYEVYEWHPQGSNRTTNAPHVITYNGGTQTLYVNQKVNGGNWNYLGTFSFAAGTAGNVRITDAFADAGQVVLADAVKFVYSVQPAVPAAPSSLSAAAVSASQINLTWTDNSTDETAFVVARSASSGGPYADLATLGANVTSYSNTGLNPASTYFYVVRAVNAAGASANSAEAGATTLAGPPTAPSGLTATAVSASQINLAWSDNAATEENYVVARATTSGGPYADIVTLPANTTSYSNTGLQSAQTYYYVVRAVNAAGSSANSIQASATTYRAAHVKAITMSWVKSGKKYKARAVVNVVDAAGKAVSGARVTGNFTGAINNSGLSGTTTTSGSATITSSSSLSSGTVTFTVTSITGTGFSYDPAANLVTSASISR